MAQPDKRIQIGLIPFLLFGLAPWLLGMIIILCWLVILVCDVILKF